MRAMRMLSSYGFNMEPGNHRAISFRKGVQKGSYGLISFGKNLKLSVFPEDLKISEKKIFDPQNKSLQLWNRLFVLTCILGISCDPLFFYLPFIYENNCLGLAKNFARAVTTWRTLIDVFYTIRIVFQFRTAFIAPSSRVFGRGELVIDPEEIAKRYIGRGKFFIDVLSILPLPQIPVWMYMNDRIGVHETKVALLILVLLQYVPRIMRFFPLASELKKNGGVIIESAFVGAMFYLIMFLLCSHIVGSFWYLLALQRNVYCWEVACKATRKCNTHYLYCSNHLHKGFNVRSWMNISTNLVMKPCTVDDENSAPKLVEFGIYQQALEAGVFHSRFFAKIFYCLWWGLQNLSTLGQGLETSVSKGEIGFSIAIAIAGLILFALIIGNIQTYLQSLSLRIEQMRLRRRDAEQWMHHRALPQDLRERVRRYDQYRWVETRGVDEQSLVESLPKDLRRDIKRHLCLGLVRRVPLFANMDIQLLDAICERLKPCLYTEGTRVVREGDPVEEILFIIRGRLESETTDGGRTGFYNRSILKEGDFCGDELLTWSLDPKTGAHLPSSTRTAWALTEVEAFALGSEDMKFVATQFRRLHSRQVQQTFRFYSQQWRTWAAVFIQTAWRRYTKRKMELHEMEELEDDIPLSSSTLGVTILASRFATNALRGIQRLRNVKHASELVPLNKPSEPDFDDDLD